MDKHIQVLTQSQLPLWSGHLSQLADAVQTVLAGEGTSSAEVSLVVVSDETIHHLNRQHLSHDYATDVLSFVLSEPGEPLEGEIVVSGDTAARQAAQYGWAGESELLLYVIHASLHLVGYDDHSPGDAQAMRDKERFYLGKWNLVPPWDQPADKVGGLHRSLGTADEQSTDGCSLAHQPKSEIPLHGEPPR